MTILLRLAAIEKPGPPLPPASGHRSVAIRIRLRGLLDRRWTVTSLRRCLASAFDATCRPAGPPALPPSTPALDHTMVAALNGLGGAAFATDLITEFERDGTQILDDIENACTVPDLHRFRTAPRSFASIPAILGTRRVGDVYLRSHETSKK